jgi:hypothetical protein
MNKQLFTLPEPLPAKKFQHPDITAKGEPRAQVSLKEAKTLWFNTGTLCNIECLNCYIESSPKNDALVYISTAEVEVYLNQIEERNWLTKEIAFTGGEPFMNPDMIDITMACLERGYNVLILTNAMLPMMRNSIKIGLLDLKEKYPGKLTLRISLDHYSAEFHDQERGKGSYAVALKGMHWLQDNGFVMHVAGRTVWGDTDAQSRSGYEALFAEQGFDIDAQNPEHTLLFPEMDETVEVPEITTSCWNILNKSPDDVMCSSSRMVVKYKGSENLSVLACTLLPYDNQFNLGETREEAEQAVKLNHPHCAKFCVLGGATCSS